MKKLAIMGAILATVVAMLAVTVTPVMAKPPAGVPAKWSSFTIPAQTLTQAFTLSDQYYDAEDNAIVQKIKFTLGDISIDIDGTTGTLSDMTVKTTVVWPLLPGEEYEEGVTGVGGWFSTHTGYGHGNFHGTMEIDGETYKVSGGIGSETTGFPAETDATMTGTRIRAEVTWEGGPGTAALSGEGLIKLLP